MTSTRILLASTAISLASLGSSSAAPFSQLRTPDVAGPAVAQSLKQVQLSVDAAEARLAEALARKAEAEASGGDLATAQEEVEAARAELAAAQAAAQGAVEPAAEPPAKAEPGAEPNDVPPASEEAPAERMPEAAAGPERAIEPQAENPAAKTAPVEEATEPAADVQAAPESPVATDEPSSAAEPDTEAETAAEPEAAAESEAPSITKPSLESVEQPEADPAEADPAAPAPDSPAASETPAEAAEVPAVEAVPEPRPTADADKEAGMPAVEQDEVLTLPVKDGAPVLDSAKEEPAGNDAGPARSSAPASSEPAPEPPASDAEAQASTAQGEPAPKALSERGERTSERPEREVQTNVSIVNQIDNRTIIKVDNRTIVEHDDRDRLRAGSDEVYYERLRGGRVREVITRPNGVQLVTVTNRWGDVIQRSRVMPNGQEYVLFYADANSDGSRDAFVDPGRRLPPLRLSIPVSDYILDSTEAEPSAFLDFLMEPPVERVERLYSVEEVRRSARIRDKVRRIDLDSLTFEFGKATIAEDQIQRLSEVADAIARILQRNPAETFLVEGHTDAVGRDEANLLLSDRRAETIAVALSDVFGIPPENLVTQGYGERYLKVSTEAPERLNRRVTIRRITPLVAPVASR